MVGFVSETVENNVGIGENAAHKNFLLNNNVYRSLPYGSWNHGIVWPWVKTPVTICFCCLVEIKNKQ